MALSREEIILLIDKLRARFDDSAKRLSPKWFDRDAFEERLAMATGNRMNLEGFILAEIANFEKLRERYEKKKGDRSFSQKVDRIIEENIARIKKYPPIVFHPRAGLEIVHCYGALSDFAQHWFVILSSLMPTSEYKDTCLQMEDRLALLAVPRGTLPARRIEDHQLLLNRKGVTEIEIERDRNEYLKETAFILHDAADLCGTLLELRSADWETPLQFSRLFIEDRRKKTVVQLFTECTGYGAIMKVCDRALQIIEDFRLGAIKRA